MKMKLIFVLALAYYFSPPAFAQSPEHAAVKKVIEKMFEGMRKGDSAMVHLALAPGIIHQSIPASPYSFPRTESAESFLKAVGTPHAQVWDVRISFNQVLVDESLATVWTNYKFYEGDTFSHCGVNSFQLVKGKDDWKIVSLFVTKRIGNCPE